MESYQKHINRPTSHNQGPYFVIGTDIAASTVARILHDNGLDVHIVKTDAAEAHALLDAEDSSIFPNWMEQRVASMCEHHQTDTLDDVRHLLRKDIKVVDEVSDEGLVVFQRGQSFQIGLYFHSNHTLHHLLIGKFELGLLSLTLVLP